MNIFERFLRGETRLRFPEAEYDISQQEATLLLNRFEDSGGEEGMKLHDRRNVILWGSEARVYKVMLGNGLYGVIKTNKGSVDPNQYFVQQIEGQELLRRYGVKCYAPIRLVQGLNGKWFLVQRYVEGSEIMRKTYVDRILRNFGLTMCEPVANAIYTPQFSPEITLIDFSHIRELGRIDRDQCK